MTMKIVNISQKRNKINHVQSLNILRYKIDNLIINKHMDVEGTCGCRTYIQYVQHKQLTINPVFGKRSVDCLFSK